MKTLLINPEAPKVIPSVGGHGNVLSLGLAYIAAVLEQYHEVEVIDNNVEKLNRDQLKRRIEQINPEVIGATSDSFSFSNAKDIATIAKETDKNIIVVVGGPHPNVWPKKSLEDNCFDISVYGEGEATAVELWEKLEKGDDISNVDGIAYKKNGKIIVNPRRKLIEELDSIPFPVRHLFPINKYPRRFLDLRTMPGDTISTSRGCPYSCNYCSNRIIYGRIYRYRSPENIVNEIALLVKEYGTKAIYFREDIFTINKKRVIGICDEIRNRGIKIDWACESRVDTVDGEMLNSMKDAGCKTVWFGVESGSQEMLDRLNKQITVQQVKKTFDLCRKVGIRAGASFMIGIPGETVENIHKTIDFACSLKPALAWFCIFLGIPSSPMYEYIVKNGLFSRDIGNGILLVKTDEFDRNYMERLQKYANRKSEGPFRYYGKKCASIIPTPIKKILMNLSHRY